MFSASASGEATAYGHGTQSCGVWVAEKEEDSSFFISLHAWVAGFVSGVGFVGVDIKETDNDAMSLFVTNYCNANPLADVADAASALILEFMEQ